MHHDELIIRNLIADLHSAICAKHIDRILSYYASHAVIFNVKPPFQIRQLNDWREVWDFSLSHFPASFGTETKDMSISVSGDLAVAHYLVRFTRMPSQTWIRVTTVYRKSHNQWQITHEHNSIPFDPETGKAVFEAE